VSSLVRWPIPDGGTIDPGADAGAQIITPPVPVATEPEQDAGTLIGWWDAQKQTGYANNAAVGSATDHSGNGRALTQGTGANQPLYITASAINGKPAFRHDGSNDVLSTAAFSSNAQPNTLVFIVKLNSVAGAMNLVDGIVNTARHTIATYGAPYQWHLDTSASIGGGTPDTTAPHIVRGIIDGANSQLWVDGTMVASGDAGNHALTGLVVGAEYWLGGNMMNGEWGELLTYEGRIEGSAWATLETYLLDKWDFGGAPVVGAATGSQRSSGTAAVRKQAIGATQGAQRTTGTAAGIKSVARAATTAQRSSGAATARKQAAGTTSGAQRSSGVATSVDISIAAATGAQRVTGAATGRKQITGAAVGAQRTTANTCFLGYEPGYEPGYADCPGISKGGIGAAAGRQRTAGQVARVVGPTAAATGAQRTTGQTSGAKTAARSAVGQQRPAGQVVAAKRAITAAAAAQRSSGTTTARKQATGAAAGRQRTAGQVTSALFTGPAAVGAQRTSGTTTGRHGGTGVAAGQLRLSGTSAGVHRSVGATVGRQRTAGTTAAAKGARGAAVGRQRSAGRAEFLLIPAPRWMEGDTVATNLVEGDQTGTGQLEGALVGAGIIEGSASL
jgi:hypothetical protein